MDSVCGTPFLGYLRFWSVRAGFGGAQQRMRAPEIFALSGPQSVSQTPIHVTWAKHGWELGSHLRPSTNSL